MSKTRFLCRLDAHPLYYKLQMLNFYNNDLRSDSTLSYRLDIHPLSGHLPVWWESEFFLRQSTWTECSFCKYFRIYVITYECDTLAEDISPKILVYIYYTVDKSMCIHETKISLLKTSSEDERIRNFSFETYTCKVITYSPHICSVGVGINGNRPFTPWLDSPKVAHHDELQV